MNVARLRRPAATVAALLAAAALASGCSSEAGGTPASCGYAFVMQDPMSGSTAEQTIQRGLDRARSEHGATVDVVDGSGLGAVADNLRAAAAKGCYTAVGTAFFANGDAVTQVAAEYPDQQFFISGGVAQGPNVTSFNAANEEGTYVAGAMAAAMTRTHTIGVITGDDSPTLRRYSSGFVAGAASVDPTVKVLQASAGTFVDAAKVGSIAVNQAGQGADVIYSAAGSNLQVYALGREKGYQTIASDLTDWASVRSTGPALAFIAAPTEDVLNETIIDGYVEGTVHGGATRNLGLRDHIFTIPYVTDDGTGDYSLAPEVVDAGKKAYQHVLSGAPIAG